MTVNLIPAIILYLLSFYSFYALFLRCRSAWTRLILALLGAALAVPPVLLGAVCVLGIPQEQWLIEFRSLPGFEAVSGMVGAGLGVIFSAGRVRPNRSNLYILGICSLTAAVMLAAPFVGQLKHSMAYRVLRDKRDGETCLQSFWWSGLPACSATVLNLYGSKASEPEITRESGTTETGTEMWYLKRAVRRRGCDINLVKLQSIRQAPVPCIMNCRLGEARHNIVLLAKDDKGVIVGDPIFGHCRYTWEALRSRYHMGSTCFTMNRVEDDSLIWFHVTRFGFPRLARRPVDK